MHSLEEVICTYQKCTVGQQWKSQITIVFALILTSAALVKFDKAWNFCLNFGMKSVLFCKECDGYLSDTFVKMRMK
jgi:hypothetical protein